MSWICDSCGYENDYNNDTKPTECACCGEPASQIKIMQATQELDNSHWEQERHAKLEYMRQLALKHQERIQLILSKLSQMVKYGVRSCVVFLVFSIVLLGYSCFKGENSTDNIVKNVGDIISIKGLNTVVENMETEIYPKTNYIKRIWVKSDAWNRDKTYFNDNYEYLTSIQKDKFQNSIAEIPMIQQKDSIGNKNISANTSVSFNNVNQTWVNMCSNLVYCKQTALLNVEKLMHYIYNRTKE